MSISAGQIRKIHAAKRTLGLDDATYRQMLENIAGVGSSTELTPRGVELVLRHLEQCGFAPRPRDTRRSRYLAYLNAWATALGTRPGHHATPAQLARIETDWDELSWYWTHDGAGDRDAALRGFLRRRFQGEDLRFLSFNQAHQCIEAFKSIARRRHA